MIIQIAKNGSIFNNPHFITISALDKNLNANANSKNPNTTFTVVNQPPDFGNELIQLGKAANKANGKAKAKPKPAIPEVNCIAPPSEDNAPASSDPKIGPVQEKETKAKVNAIKKIPMIPPAPSAELALLVHFSGKVNS